MTHSSYTDYAYDWAAPLGSITLGILMLDPHSYLVAKETVVILSIIIGIVTNGIRLYKEWKNRNKDGE